MTRPLAILVCLLIGTTAGSLSAQTEPTIAETPLVEPTETPALQTDMPLWKAAVLGTVEGLTEYLPVSSTGHLILAKEAMGIGAPAGADPDTRERIENATDAYTICIQAGAIIAVLMLYFGRVRQALRGFTGDVEGRQLLFNILAGFIPAAVIGLLINDWVKAYLFGGDRWGMWPTIAAWFVGGMAILIVGWTRRGDRDPHKGKSLEQLTWQLALIIGFAQCIAMWPGVSRSLVTIVGGVLVGLRLAAAVEFSFLLGLITLGAATVYDALKHGDDMLETYSPLSLAVGLLFALASALLAVKWMVAYLNKHGLQVFGYYRVALAIVVAVLVLTNAL